MDCYRQQQSLSSILFLALLLPVASRGQAISNSDTVLDELSSRAQEAQSRADYRAAAASYREMLKLQPQLVEVRANLGLMHHLLGEYNEAIRHFEAALRQKPQLFVPNLFLGLDLLRTQQPRQALPYLQRAHTLNPRDEQATLGLGQAYAAVRDFQKANEFYLGTTVINPGNADAWYGLGVTYLSLQQTAVEQLKRADRNSSYFRVLLAESLEQQGRVRDAITLYRQVLELHSSQPCLHAMLGVANVNLGDLAAAEAELLTELKDSPGCLLARLGLARVSYQRGDFLNGLRQLDEAWKVDRSFVETNASQFWQGFSAEKVEELERKLKQHEASEAATQLSKFLIGALERWHKTPAETSLRLTETSTDDVPREESPQQASLKDPTSPARLYSQGQYTRCLEKLKAQLAPLRFADLLLLAQCAYFSGDYRSSFLASGEAVKASPESLPGLYWRVKASQKLAVSALVRAGLAEPNSHRVHLLLAQTYLEKHDFKEAESEYRKAIQLKPNDLAAHLGLATTYYRVFQFDKALPELERVLQISSKDPEACYFMGEVLVHRRHYAEALPYLKTALNGVPSTILMVHALIGKVYASQGRDIEAVTELKQSLAADRDGSYHYQLYQLYKKVGDEKAAKAALQKSEILRRNQLDSQRAQFSLFSQ